MNNNCLFFWRPYLSLLILNSIYVLYAYIRFEKSPEIPLTGFAAFFNGALIRSHSDDPKTNVLYSYMIPLIYLPPNEPNILLQRPIKNLKMDDCWLMTGFMVFVCCKWKRFYSVKFYH